MSTITSYIKPEGGQIFGSSTEFEFRLRWSIFHLNSQNCDVFEIVVVVVFFLHFQSSLENQLFKTSGLRSQWRDCLREGED